MRRGPNGDGSIVPAPRLRRRIAAALGAALAGAAAAALVACGSSAKLIPVSAAGPLKDDFEAVAQAAAQGEGSCAATEAALLKTEQDFAALPQSLDSGLRSRLRQGITNLRNRALAECASATTTATTATTPNTTTTSTTPTTPTTETTTTTTPTQTTTTETTPTQTTTPTPGGGTQAKEGKEAETPAGDQGGGTPSGGAGQGNGQGNGQ